MNWQIIGHKSILNYLENAIVSDRLSHAYLFYGPKQVGKKETAKNFAKSIFCHSQLHISVLSDFQIPCGSCKHCQEFDKKIHPDFYWLKKNKDEKNISIEQIRDLRHRLSVRSFFKSYKIAVIQEAETMSLGAANCLLKTLEEPLGKTIIILLAEKIELLPKTIISRTQKVKFLQVSGKEIYEYLVLKLNINRDLALNLANVSCGRLGRALFFLSRADAWSNYLQQINTFLKLLSSSPHEKIRFAELVLEKDKNFLDKVAVVKPLLNLWQYLFRDMLLLKIGEDDRIINSRARKELKTLCQYFTFKKLLKINNQLEITKNYLKQNINPRLALENLLLEF